MVPSCLAAIRGWLRASRQLGNHARCALALEAEAKACMVPRHKSVLFFEAGQAWQLRQDDQDRAIDAYQEVLKLDPMHAQAYSALMAIHTARKDWPALIELLGHGADLQQDPLEVKGILIRIAELQRARLGDITAARKTITKALAIDGDDVSLLTTLAELCRTENDWKALTRVDQRLTRLTADPLMLKALHFELGRIWEEKLGNVPKAIAEYRKVLKMDINDLGALTHLSKLLQKEMNWPAAAKTTERLIERDDNRMRVKGYYLRLAHIYSVGFKNSRSAIEACRNALSLDLAISGGRRGDGQAAARHPRPPRPAGAPGFRAGGAPRPAGAVTLQRGVLPRAAEDLQVARASPMRPTCSDTSWRRSTRPAPRISPCCAS